jgi:hypothetical protein
VEENAHVYRALGHGTYVLVPHNKHAAPESCGVLFNGTAKRSWSCIRTLLLIIHQHVRSASNDHAKHLALHSHDIETLALRSVLQRKGPISHSPTTNLQLPTFHRHLPSAIPYPISHIPYPISHISRSWFGFSCPCMCSPVNTYIHTYILHQAAEAS